MPPNRPSHKRQKSSILNQGNYNFTQEEVKEEEEEEEEQDKQGLQPSLPPFAIPVTHAHTHTHTHTPAQVQASKYPQAQVQAQAKIPSTSTNLDPLSLINQQIDFPHSSNRRTDEQDVYNYCFAPSHTQTHTHAYHNQQQQQQQHHHHHHHSFGSNVNLRQHTPQSQRVQYEYNQELQGSVPIERRVASTGYDRFNDFHPISPPQPLPTTNPNYQQGGTYQTASGPPLHQYRQQSQQPPPLSQQQQQVRPISHSPQHTFFNEPNIQRSQQPSSYYRSTTYITDPSATGSFAFNPASSQAPPVYPTTLDPNHSNPQQQQQQQQALYSFDPTTGSSIGRQYSNQSLFSAASLQPTMQASSTTSGPLSIPISVVTTAPTPVPTATAPTAPTPVPTATAPTASTRVTAAPAQAVAPGHHKNALSISSHLTSISLESQNSPEHTLTTDPRRFHRDTNPVLADLLLGLFSVDGNNIGAYLHSIIYKLNASFPLDDFYNLLYNNDRQLPNSANYNYNQKIDKTPIALNSHDTTATVMNQVLDVFRNPTILHEHFPHQEGQNRLFSINYHELLRTFLAIKILNDMMIEVPSNMNQDSLTYSIPRLSIFKTYFIICQKLITRYPSSSNTTNEQQKLILGQSKLGKLIKMVYPNLSIKRLGSRGESRYHYLGVIWNEHIIDNNVKQLCEQHDLANLSEMFSEGVGGSSEGGGSTGSNFEQNEQNVLLPERGSMSDRQIGAIPSGVSPKKRGRKRSRSSVREKSYGTVGTATETSDAPHSDTISVPRLSFLKKDSKFPLESSFTTVLVDNNEDKEIRPNWFTKLLDDTYAKSDVIDRDLIKFILLNNSNLTQDSNLLKNLLKSVFKPSAVAQPHTTTDDSHANIDLLIYTIILFESLPYLLLIEPSADINMVTNLRLNLLYLINHLPDELKLLNSPVLPLENAAKFLIVVKKMINLNDLMITFIKLLNKKELNTMMVADIQHFLLAEPHGIGLQQGSGRWEVGEGEGEGEQDRQGGEGDEGGANLLPGFNATSISEVKFNFKKDILSNDLIHSLIGFQFDPNSTVQLKRGIPVNTINEDVTILNEFFKVDLLTFLTPDDYYETEKPPAPKDSFSKSHASSLRHYQQEVRTSVGSIVPLLAHPQPSLQQHEAPHNTAFYSQPIGQQPIEPNTASSSSSNMVLTTNEMSKLKSLLALIDTKLLSPHFKSRYPIQLYNSFITFVLNDVLKHIFLKQQQRSQVGPVEESSTSQGNRVNPIKNPNFSPSSSGNSFGSWWVFNSIIQEYLSLLGELVGLQDSI